MVQTGIVLNGRYEIVRLIAEGGMGAVYEGRDLKFGGGPVAIKRCLMTGDAMQRAFIREAELLANLSHPGVAKARDLFAEPDGQYLVMEYIPGNDLEKLLNERGRPIALENALEWADQVLDALSYMHGRRPPVIHRDIKPSNLKLTPSGHIMLIDFGLAKGNGTTSLAGYSVNYAPLEQLQGEGTDPRSDLYALGATLYRLLTGRAPESALDRVKLMAKHQRDPLISAHVINPQIPESVAHIIRDAMAIEIEDRLHSAIEMRDRLRQAGGFLALNYQLASAPTQYDQFTEKLPDMGSVLANGRSTFLYAGNVLSTTPNLNRSVPPVSVVPGAFPSQPVVEANYPVRSTVVATVAEPAAAAPGQVPRSRSVGKYLVATCCLVSLLVLGVAGNGYRNWRVAKAKEQQQQAEQLAASLQPAQTPVPASPAPEPQNLVSPPQNEQKAADDSAALEIARRKALREAEMQRQAAIREANRMKQEAAEREVERLKQEAAMREAEKQKQEAAARELEKQKAAWEAEKLRQQIMAREAERQKQEAAAREHEKQKAAWEAERQKAARESEKQLAALEAERQKAAREAEKQRQASAARAAAYAKQQEKIDAANKKAEKEAKELKEAKKQKKREEEKKEAHTGVRVGVSILGGILGRRRP
jgi:serine/threonine protein kinase